MIQQKIKWIAALNQCIIILVFMRMQTPDHPPVYHLEWDCYLKQPDGITCGPTSCAMVINWYGKEATVQSCKAQARSKWFEYNGAEVGMTLPDYITFCLRSHGIPAKLESGNIHKLKYYVSEKRPPIVLLRSGDRYWHYVVVTGYGENKIVIADPGGGRREEMDEKIFLGSWDFSCDMQGKEVAGFDLFRYIVERVAGVSGHTMIVPKESKGS